jgi:hypothetical protein
MIVLSSKTVREALVLEFNTVSDDELAVEVDPLSIVLPVTIKLPVITAEPLKGNGLPAGAYEALVAKDAVPNKDPVILPDTLKLPVTL